ncbi:hypothetical protein QBC34DRAFT_198642 [Podospora aff. communis PSN243]|uniref:NACHT domain-containing protein n=1 Tax=Podospora aff. communis PSN243 TaxID=3040156 RepID=A0AAV9G708_9PEZI|nr:hypothetical protein QBC34DRAFT_198642 [Podospora aff. communis PSN243]
MEAIVAVGLASNVAQFLDFATKLVSESREIYRSSRGTTSEFESLDSMCTLLGRLSDGLAPPVPPNQLHNIPVHSRPIREEILLAEVAVKCKKASEALRTDLERMRLEASARGRTASLRQAFAGWLGRPRIAKLQREVEDCRKDLLICLEAVTTQRQSSILRQLSALRETGLNRVHDHSAEFQRLEELVSDLKAGVEKLLIPDKGDASASLHSIAMQLDRISAASTRNWIAEHALVETLFFETLSVRHDSIPEAHKETFKWLFVPGKVYEDGTRRPSTNLLQWLQDGNGTYWVSGKPGSGKSTLMKFMAGHAQVRAALKRWSGTNQCIKAAYYFWNAGTMLQKSVEGLLRSLLFDIFTRNPELISVGAPERWETTKAEIHSQRYRVIGTGGNITHQTWTVPEMLEALSRLSVAAMSKKFCLFIDGLDEYHGDHLDLIRIITTLSKGQNFKLCVSSRPWNVFEDSLGLDPEKRLNVHDLTKHDIQRYILSTMEDNIHWKVESERDPSYRALADEITQRAQGVFLWVVLVVRSLQEGLTNGDSIQLLQRRTSELPDELEPFFRHILASVPKIYHMQMALYFRVALDAPEPPTMALYSFLEDSLERVLAPKYDWLSPPISSQQQDVSMGDRIKLTRRRLNARSKGLLDADPRDIVQFLHRTVRDFLLSPEMSNLLDEKIGNTPVDRVVLGAYVDYFTMARSCIRDSKDGDRIVVQAMFYGSKVEKESPEKGVALITKLADLMADASDAGNYRRPGMVETFVWQEVIRNGLIHFLKHRYLTGVGSGGQLGSRKDILLQTLRFHGHKIDGGPSGRMDVLRTLLASGVRVHKVAWDEYMEYLLEFLRNPGTAGNSDAWSWQLGQEEFEVFTLAASHTGDVNAKNHQGALVWEEIFFYLVEDLRSSRGARARVPSGFRRQFIQTLFTYGADPNAPCQFSATLWSWFSTQVRCDYSGGWDPEHLEPIANIAEILIKAGADLRHEKSLNDTDVKRVFPPRLAIRILSSMEEQKRQKALKQSWSGWIGSWFWNG